MAPVDRNLKMHSPVFILGENLNVILKYIGDSVKIWTELYTFSIIE